ncbi:MAG: ABC transporter substrate-binding protein [Chloroflexi bacterium]|nr:ABC transporter substrate-binding protein [Chloroflexota bacterium]
MKAVLALATILALAGCGSAAAPANGPSASTVALRTAINGTSPSATYEWITKDAGIFSKHGLDVSLTAMAGSPAMDALLGGDVDYVIHAGPQLVLAAYANGSPLKVVAGFEHVYDLQLVVPSDVTAVEQLKDKRLGTSDLNAEDATAAVGLLREHGLAANTDYQLIQTGSQGSNAGIVAAMLTHQIDAAALSPTFAQQAASQGPFHILVDFAQTDIHTASQVLTFPAPYVQQHADVVQRTVDALIEGVHYFRDHKAEATAAMRSHYRLDDQAQMDALYDRQVELIAKAPTISKDDLVGPAAELPKDVPKLTDDKLASLADNSFVDDATKRGLTNY